MKFKNEDRNLLKIVREICAERSIDMKLLSEDWIIKLSNGRRERYIFGYNFEINSSTSQMIAQDKSAASYLLQDANVPVVEHELFMNPTIHKYFNGAGNWAKLRAYFESHGGKVVCKPTRGTGGNDVFIIDDYVDLEITVQKLFAIHRSIALSPFYEIDEEYRVIMLDGEAMVCYTKLIPFVLGDGEKSVYELIQNTIQDEDFGNVIKNIENVDITAIPKKGERISLHWKHNLGILAAPKIIEDEALKSQLAVLARRACEAINIRFASVDIVTINGEMNILEINSGVMGESFSRSSNEAFQITKNVYERVIETMFSDE